MFACKLSEGLLGFTQTQQVVEMLQQYGLPTNFKIKNLPTEKILRSLLFRLRNIFVLILMQDIIRSLIRHRNLFIALQPEWVLHTIIQRWCLLRKVKSKRIPNPAPNAISSIKVELLKAPPGRLASGFTNHIFPASRNVAPFNFLKISKRYSRLPFIFISPFF